MGAVKVQAALQNKNKNAYCIVLNKMPGQIQGITDLYHKVYSR